MMENKHKSAFKGRKIQNNYLFILILKYVINQSTEKDTHKPDRYEEIDRFCSKFVGGIVDERKTEKIPHGIG